MAEIPGLKSADIVLVHGESKSSWHLVATDDSMIPPLAQRFMSNRAGSTVVEVEGSHAIYVSQPNAVAALIEKAAREVNPIIANILPPERGGFGENALPATPEKPRKRRYLHVSGIHCRCNPGIDTSTLKSCCFAGLLNGSTPTFMQL